ncbi:isoprenyl transferase [Cryptosporidium felis]|nr:isoprenyl transferase [Cryptosporidium felis]
MLAFLRRVLEVVLSYFLSFFPVEHVAIILDGNRRYAKLMGISQMEGHREGAFLIKRILPLFSSLRVKYVSMFVFSMENFSRKKEDVDDTFEVIKNYILSEGDWLYAQNFRVLLSGELKMLPGDLERVLRDLESLTKENTGIFLNICCAYSSTTELEMASMNYLESYRIFETKALKRESSFIKQVEKKALSDEMFKSFIYNPEVPFPNVLIRTSGETRLSDFLIYQTCHNTRMYFVSTLWPQINNITILTIMLHYVLFYL